MSTTTTIEFKRVQNNVNGNPRYVCHFFELLTKKEVSQLQILESYNVAVLRAKKIGGKRFSNKQYGGGIVFVSFNITDLERKIKELVSLYN